MQQLTTRDPFSCQCSHERLLTLCDISYHCQKNHLLVPILGYLNPIPCFQRSFQIQFSYFCTVLTKSFQERQKEAVLCH